MPASTISPDLNCNNAPNSGLEDQRALQLALELTMLGLHSPDSELDCNEYDINDELNKKRSQNMTECVPVPSSEHVAEIVGRQGCKIKALRAKTNTYIKTPVRGEEPVFVVTGRKEDVGDAKREILSAAEHFSQIRASRRNNNHGSVNGLCPPSPNSPGQVTLQVRVPYRVVGLVVGPKGATIKRIQQLTHTYIVTPSRDKEPVFEVTGKAEHVEKARIEIEKHIAMRTGGLLLENGVTPDDIESNGYEIDQLNNEQLQSRMNSAYNVYNAMNNNNLNGNHVLAARQSQLIMQDYSNLNAGGKRGDPFHDVGFGQSDLVYDPYSSLLNGRFAPRSEDDLLTTSQCGWNGQQVPAVNGWPAESQQQRVIYGKMAANQTSVATTPIRRNSLESSPHLSPGSDQGLPTHATIRRISSDPVSSSETANAWNSFQAMEFGSGFGNGIQSHDESPQIQDNN